MLEEEELEIVNNYII